MEFITQISIDLTWIAEICTKEMRRQIESDCVDVAISYSKKYAESKEFFEMWSGYKKAKSRKTEKTDEELLNDWRYYGLSQDILKKHLDLLRILNARMD